MQRQITYRSHLILVEIRRSLDRFDQRSPFALTGQQEAFKTVTHLPSRPLHTLISRFSLKNAPATPPLPSPLPNPISENALAFNLLLGFANAKRRAAEKTAGGMLPRCWELTLKLGRRLLNSVWINRYCNYHQSKHDGSSLENHQPALLDQFRQPDRL
ncbi:hypothetical protein PGT21_018322 [Puccinia graminis f. sp. tritici]|uniref:Uncharacterized protein n=1 Tax=Puccinia graminis f. sp. tritici TaxID=56615 RepID=A0A5B0QB58_PUCGR|nr:hypothetical protein PGT21_018322 [Puccinia graminis f. sp. tritici]